MKVHSPKKLLVIPIIYLLLGPLQGCQSLSGDRWQATWRHAIPKRPQEALSGSAFARSIEKANESTREAAVLHELRRGNLPESFRLFQPVHIASRIPGFGPVEATFWVMPDYLAIGHKEDLLRIPMNPITAQHIADHYGCVLPTRKMVELIYQQSKIKLEPKPMAYGPKMVSIAQYSEHNEIIKQQLQSFEATGLIAGHKKDVVLSKRLRRQPGRVAIYGWHRSNGKAIQPLSLVHGNYYADYSHGIRLVANMMQINGTLYPIAEVMKHPQLSAIISDEGALPYGRYPTEGTLKKTRWFPKGWNS